MSEDFGPNFITLTDEDGKEIVMEHISTLEYEGNQYCMFLPAEMEGEEIAEEEMGYVILQIVEEDGEEVLVVEERMEIIDEIFAQYYEMLGEE